MHWKSFLKTWKTVVWRRSAYHKWWPRGLGSACRAVLGSITWQRCQHHFNRMRRLRSQTIHADGNSCRYSCLFNAPDREPAGIPCRLQSRSMPFRSSFICLVGRKFGWNVSLSSIFLWNTRRSIRTTIASNVSTRKSAEEPKSLVSFPTKLLSETYFRSLMEFVKSGRLVNTYCAGKSFIWLSSMDIPGSNFTENRLRNLVLSEESLSNFKIYLIIQLHLAKQNNKLNQFSPKSRKHLNQLRCVTSATRPKSQRKPTSLGWWLILFLHKHPPTEKGATEIGSFLNSQISIQDKKSPPFSGGALLDESYLYAIATSPRHLDDRLLGCW